MENRTNKFPRYRVFGLMILGGPLFLGGGQSATTWAFHHQIDPEVTGQSSTCGPGYAIVTGVGDPSGHSVATGTYNFYLNADGRFLGSRDVSFGIDSNVFTFNLPDLGCDLSISIFGVSGGFEIAGPRVVCKNHPTVFPLLLPGDTDPWVWLASGRLTVQVTLEAGVAPVGALVADDGAGGMIFNDQVYRWGQDNPLVINFLYPGKYHLKYTWIMPGPPDMTQEKDVSTAEKDVWTYDVELLKPGTNEKASEVRPVGTGDDAKSNVDVRVFTGVPAPFTVHVGMYAEGKDGSGGHEADKHESPRPAGLFDPDQMFGEMGGGTKEYKCQYTAGEFGGADQIFVVLSEEPMDARNMDRSKKDGKQRQAQKALKEEAAQKTDEVCVHVSEIEVKVPNLLPLSTSPSGHYVKVGGTCQHHGPRDDSLYPDCRTPDNNHWATIGTLNKVEVLAIRWRGHTKGSGTLHYNDISLRNGGGFDVNGQWKVDLNASNHGGHRKGKSVDVRTGNGSDGIPLKTIKGKRRNSEFEALLKRPGCKGVGTVHSPNTSNEHYHVDF